MIYAALLLLQDGYRTTAELETAEIERPARARESFGYLGVTSDRDYRGFGVKIRSIAEDSPAQQVGIEEGDVIVGFGDEEIADYDELRAAVRTTKPDDKRWVFIERDGEPAEYEVTMGSAQFGMTMWTKPKFNLAVVLVEFDDVRHNPKFSRQTFHDLLFSRGSFTSKNPSGERVYGSLADYYDECSYGKLAVTGRVFDWVRLEQPRSHFEQASMQSKAFRAEFRDKAVDLIRERDGADVFEAFDGVIILYAGDQSHYRPRALWPHRASLRIGKKSFPYYLSSEGGEFLASIGVHVHEFGHMLGLPDQYGAKHASGIGKWCVMAVGHMGGGESRNHRPYQLCAWCKMRLGWVTPAVVDPQVTQWVRLDPVETDGAQVVQILSRADGSEYLLLENRQRIGFDGDLDADGLLIWRVGGRGGVDLVESHGRKERNASLLETDEIPYPSAYNNAFTPLTAPSSKAARSGAREVWIADIVEKDGVVYLKIGERNARGTWTPPSGGFH